MNSSRLYLFFTLILLLCTSSPILASTADGGTSVDTPTAGFSSPEEAKWYRTFQEGSMLVDGWQDITREILAKMPPEKREEQRRILEKLGEKIGREWARDNSIRKIDTDMLRQWGKELRKAADQRPEQLPEVIHNLVEKVDSILATPKT